jgi:hypothetical protein
MLIPPTLVEVATGRSVPESATLPVIKPSALYVMPAEVAGVTVLAMPSSPAAVTDRPEVVGTETPPSAVVVASGKSLPVRAAVPVM